MSVTKQDVARYAAEKGIEIEDEGSGRDRHIHGYSPDGFIFKATETHNIGCYDGGHWDGKPVDWTHVMGQLKLIPCPNYPNCEICNEETYVGPSQL